jgi:hypothetical protein
LLKQIAALLVVTKRNEEGVFELGRGGDSSGSVGKAITVCFPFDV